MPLIKSISGIRGTIHPEDNEGLSTQEIIQSVNQLTNWLTESSPNKLYKIAVGRDARISGESISIKIINHLINLGINIIDLGLTTTPTLQIAVSEITCDAGIMITASHNPVDWNGLKFLNNLGEFLTYNQSMKVYVSNTKSRVLAPNKGSIEKLDFMLNHIENVINLSDVDLDKIRTRKFKVVVDGINSSGGIYVPFLLEKLSCNVIKLNCNPDGRFEHNPEPVPRNLKKLSKMVKETGSDLGIAVDPDVDRLVLICEDGSFFNEENTIVAVTKHILENHDNLNVVTNLSTTTAVKELVNENNGNHFESAVGETNVVEMMKLKKSILGGEGSGGVIFKPSHYGRDALVAICLILSYLAIKKISLKELLGTLPKYFMIKDKIIFDEKNNNKIQKYIDKKVEFCKQNKIKFSEIDGLKMWFDDKTWVHIRKSNTEPLLRLIVESFSSENAKKIKQLIVKEITFF